MANKIHEEIFKKKCSIFLAIKEMEVKTTLRSYLTPARMAIIKKTTAANVKKDIEDGNTHLLLVGI
jgi:hypothetical protein